MYSIHIAPDFDQSNIIIGYVNARTDAVEKLRQASLLNPDNARYVYVYAVGLNSTGNSALAIRVLQDAHDSHPYNGDILTALVAFHRDSGNDASARVYADKLEKLRP